MESNRTDPQPATRMAFLPLTVAIVITLVLTIYPLLLAHGGKANHTAAMLAFWSMSAGYVRGVGFTPRNRLLKLLFSTTTCLLALLAAVIVMRPWI